MSALADRLRLARAHELTLNLRTLQRHLNQTIDALDALTAEGGDVLGGGRQEFEPAFFTQALSQPVFTQPEKGLPLGSDAHFYVGKHSGVLQLIQSPDVSGPAVRHTLNLLYANFEGQWMSVAFDLRALLAQANAGALALVVTVDHSCLPVQTKPVQLKCTWRIAGAEPMSRQVQLAVDMPVPTLIDLGEWPSIEDGALDLHLIFPAEGRGSISLRSVRARLVCKPGAARGGDANLFEETL